MRLVVASLLIAGASLAAGCGVLEKREGTAPPAQQPSQLARTAEPSEPSQPTEPGEPVVPEGFRVFTGDGFRVALPCTPEEETIPVGVTKGVQVEAHAWTCASSEVAFAVSTTTFPRGVPFDLDSASAGSARRTGGTVVAEETVTYQGLPGRDITIKVERGGQTAMSFARALLRGRTVVQVNVVVIGDAPDPPSDFPRILGSLELT